MSEADAAREHMPPAVQFGEAPSHVPSNRSVQLHRPRCFARRSPGSRDSPLLFIPSCLPSARAALLKHAPNSRPAPPPLSFPVAGTQTSWPCCRVTPSQTSPTRCPPSSTPKRTCCNAASKPATMVRGAAAARQQQQQLGPGPCAPPPLAPGPAALPEPAKRCLPPACVRVCMRACGWPAADDLRRLPNDLRTSRVLETRKAQQVGPPPNPWRLAPGPSPHAPPPTAHRLRTAPPHVGGGAACPDALPTPAPPSSCRWQPAVTALLHLSGLPGRRQANTFNAARLPPCRLSSPLNRTNTTRRQRA